MNVSVTSNVNVNVNETVNDCARYGDDVSVRASETENANEIADACAHSCDCGCQMERATSIDCLPRRWLRCCYRAAHFDDHSHFCDHCCG